MLVAWHLKWFIQHTLTVNLYAPLTVPFGLTRAVMLDPDRRSRPAGGLSIRGADHPYRTRAFQSGFIWDGIDFALMFGACARGQSMPPPYGLNSHTLSAIGRWMCGPRRRSDEDVFRGTGEGRQAPIAGAQKVGRFAPEERG